MVDAREGSGNNRLFEDKEVVDINLLKLRLASFLYHLLQVAFVKHLSIQLLELLVKLKVIVSVHLVSFHLQVSYH